MARVVSENDIPGGKWPGIWNFRSKNSRKVRSEKRKNSAFTLLSNLLTHLWFTELWYHWDDHNRCGQEPPPSISPTSMATYSFFYVLFSFLPSKDCLCLEPMKGFLRWLGAFKWLSTYPHTSLHSQMWKSKDIKIELVARPVLSKCRLVVVEEAAQVLEGHVIAALPPSTQHLIMIGELTFKGVFSRSFLGGRFLITPCSWIRRQIQKTLEFRPKFLFLQPGLWVKVPNDLTISTWTTIYCKYLDVFEFQPGLWGKW